MAEPFLSIRPRRCWLRFSLRTLLVIVSIVCAVAALSPLARIYQEWVIVAQIQARGASVVMVKKSKLSWIAEAIGAEPITYATRVDFHSAVSDADLEATAKLQDLLAVCSEQESVAEPGLKHLLKRPNLMILGLDSPSITDAGMDAVGQLSALQILSLRGTTLTDAGVGRLRSLDHLKWLDLRESNVTDLEYGFLSATCHLDELWIGQSRLTDKGLEAIARIKSLRILYLIDTKVTDAGLKHLAKNSSLRKLYVGGPGVTDQGIQEIAGLPLEELSLYQSAVTDEGMEIVSRMRTLHTVNLSGSKKIGDRGVMHLARMPRLKGLDLCESSVTVEGLQPLKGLKQLDYLFLLQTPAALEADRLRLEFPNVQIETE